MCSPSARAKGMMEPDDQIMPARRVAGSCLRLVIEFRMFSTTFRVQLQFCAEDGEVTQNGDT